MLALVVLPRGASIRRNGRMEATAENPPKRRGEKEDFAAAKRGAMHPHSFQNHSQSAQSAQGARV